MLPEDFISTAERLLVESTEESDQRSAISRSYYGAFHVCLENVPDQFAPKESEFDGSASHKAVIDAIAEWGIAMVAGRTEAQQVARKLNNLKRARKRADYQITEALNQRDVLNCTKDARDVIGRIRLAKSQLDRSEAA